MEIQNIQDIISLGTKFKRNWFRGHSSTFGTLIPKIFREQYNSELHKQTSDKLEFEIISQFKRLAPSLQADLPLLTNHMAWLVLMQHHGAPTRLLDWSESILVAAFFATQENSNNDAEIWRLYPQRLNAATARIDGYPLEASKQLNFLSGEPLHNNPDQLAKELELEIIPKGPVAFYPTLFFSRMSSQQSTFTIHPSKENSITEVLTHKDNLERYVIPSHLKAKILEDLLSLGINNRTLFPDLDHLSLDLNHKYRNPFWNVWGQPKSI